MTVCVCNPVIETAKDGANCLQHLETKLGVSNQHGFCRYKAVTYLEHLLEKEMKSDDFVIF